MFAMSAAEAVILLCVLAGIVAATIGRSKALLAGSGTLLASLVSLLVPFAGGLGVVIFVYQRSRRSAGAPASAGER
jgi:hypothetical protein